MFFTLLACLVAVIAALYLGNAVDLECERQTAGPIQCKRTVRTLGIPIRTLSFTNPTAVRVDESCKRGCSYQVQLETDQGRVPLVDTHTAGIQDKEESARQISQFLQNPSEKNFHLRTSNPGLILIIVALLAMGVLPLVLNGGNARALLILMKRHSWQTRV